MHIFKRSDRLPLRHRHPSLLSKGVGLGGDQRAGKESEGKSTLLLPPVPSSMCLTEVIRCCLRSSICREKIGYVINYKSETCNSFMGVIRPGLE
ncbi:unnamed protein product [Lactuca virosa]|uniref:Uncharacterized protein n=1 Tax=Lactuca virosa TaxID=75947 RepID=A0AAU9LHS5_9ASTR|nr:unnamed protein product [Lactuca virosa]